MSVSKSLSNLFPEQGNHEAEEPLGSWLLSSFGSAKNGDFSAWIRGNFSPVKAEGVNVPWQGLSCSRENSPHPFSPGDG